MAEHGHNKNKAMPTKKSRPKSSASTRSKDKPPPETRARDKNSAEAVGARSKDKQSAEPVVTHPEVDIKDENSEQPEGESRNNVETGSVRAVEGHLDDTDKDTDVGRSHVDNDAEPDDITGRGSSLSYPDVQELDDPENFDTKSFLSCISQLSSKIHSDNVRDMDQDFDGEELSEMVRAVSATMRNFNRYTLMAQEKLETLRGEIKETKERMHKKVAAHPLYADDERKTNEQRILDEKVQDLNKELARAAEDLEKANILTAKTEQDALKAAQIAKEAQVEVEKMERQAEERKQQEAERKRAYEEGRLADEKRRIEEQRRQQEEQKQEELRKARLTKKDEVETPEWQNWPHFSYRLPDPGEFDHGIGCVIRGDPNYFKESSINCKVLGQKESTLCYENSDELISNVLHVTTHGSFQKPVYIAIPHCLSRASAISREPVIKLETKDGWTAIKSHEVTLEEYKDVKLVQGELQPELLEGSFTVAVVSRFKRDYLTMPKKGGKVASTVDSRVMFIVSKGTFKDKEHFVLQMQPVDSTTVQEAKKRVEGSLLLTSSAICTMEWGSKNFKNPIIVNLPVPANPVKAKKAAAARAAKEARNQQRAAPALEETLNKPAQKKPGDNKRRNIAQTNADMDDEPAKKPTKWYMGQYGSNEDDENDSVHFLYTDSKDKWQALESLQVSPIRLDIVEFKLTEPIRRFVILRTKTNCDSHGAVKIMELLTKMLNERTVRFVVKQRADDPSDVVAYIAPVHRVDKILDMLKQEGYIDGPEVSPEIAITEGQHLGFSFRANMQKISDSSPDDLIFNSQLTNSLSVQVCEIDKFLQKNYEVYRGFIQLCDLHPVKRVVKALKKQSPKSDVEGIVTESEQQDDETEHSIEYERTVLSELLITIPKNPEDTAPQRIKTAPVTIRNSDDPITPNLLRTLSDQLGDEWLRLATHLNVKKARVQAIQRNCTVNGQGEDEAKFIMLLTWLKRVPKGMNKVGTLCDALEQSDRDDLAIEIEDINHKFLKEKTQAT